MIAQAFTCRKRFVKKITLVWLYVLKVLYKLKRKSSSKTKCILVGIGNAATCTLRSYI